jgi:hypothetical protein
MNFCLQTGLSSFLNKDLDKEEFNKRRKNLVDFFVILCHLAQIHKSETYSKITFLTEEDLKTLLSNFKYSREQSIT